MFNQYTTFEIQAISRRHHHAKLIRKPPKKVDAQGFRYDIYISYADKQPDRIWVWENLIPRLKAAGLRIATSNNAPLGYNNQEDEMIDVCEITYAMQLARRTMIVLSPNYLSEQSTNLALQKLSQIDPKEGVYRLLTVKIAPVDDYLLPSHLTIFGSVDLTQPRASKRQFNSMVAELELPLPWQP